MNKNLERGAITKAKILNAGLKLWAKDPSKVTSSSIARKIKMTHATVLYHFPKNLKDAVAKHAIDTNDKRIISQLILTNHKSVSHLTKRERCMYLKNAIESE